MTLWLPFLTFDNGLLAPCTLTPALSQRERGWEGCEAHTLPMPPASVVSRKFLR